LKLKSLAVITLLVLGCSAVFGQGSATLGFTSAGDEVLYCNFEQFEWGGYNNFYFQGVDNITDACFAEFGNATIAGVKVAISVKDGAPVLGGPAYVYADSYFDAFSGSYTGAQLLTITQIKPSKRLLHYGWVSYLGADGYEFLYNYGYLSASYPGANTSGKPILNYAHAAAGPQSQTRVRTIPKK
jgi:hypothetical protein